MARKFDREFKLEGITAREVERRLGTPQRNRKESDPAWGRIAVCHSVPLAGSHAPTFWGVALVPLFFSRSARSGRFTEYNHSGMR